MKNIIIATGGSGGHVFPAIKVAKQLTAQGHKIVFIGRCNFLKSKIEDNGFCYREISARGLDKESLSTLAGSLLAMIRSMGSSWKLIKEIKPDLVMGFGGYSSFPVVFCAALLWIPTIIHEQNVVPGKANKVLSFFVKKILISFSKSKKYFSKKKTVMCGCPVNIEKKDIDREDALKKFGLNADAKTILVVGGSQGSRKINSVMVETIELVKADIPVQVIHICGEKDRSMLFSEYEKLAIPFALFNFLDDMAGAYFLADTVVARAGAVTVSELAMLNKPCILIPYPYAGGHQMDNAKVLEEVGGAHILEDKFLSAEILKDIILRSLQIKASYSGVFIEDSVERIINEVGKLTK